jgi:hypothetical protein
MPDNLESVPTVCLVTFRRDGREVPTAVWVVGVDGRLFVNTESRSGKVKRVRHTPAVRLAPCTWRGRPLGDWRQGRASIVADAALVARVNQALRAKYGWQAGLNRFLAKFSRRIAERTILEVRLDSA